MIRRMSSRLLLAFGLASLVLSSLLAAFYIGLVPDRDSAVRAGRIALAESVAVSTALLLTHNDASELQDLLAFMMERNPALRSAGVRPLGGELLLAVGAHDTWKSLPDGRSNEAFVQVPIIGGEGRWGTLELQFDPLRAAGWRGWLQAPRVRLALFLFMAGLVSFYLYLRRMLRHLDPSKVIPTRVRAALDTLTEGLLVLDQQGLVVLANQSLATMFDKKPDELLGTSASRLPWTDQAGVVLKMEQLPWAATLQSGEALRNGLVYLQSVHGPCTFRVNASPVLGGNNRQQGVLVSLQDISELQRTEVALRAAKEEADFANRAKSAFLANMSHEIRTPMNAILGFTEVLRRGYRRSEAETARHLETISSSGKHLLELINDILDLSKIESGHLEIERIPFACHDVIQQVVQTLGVKAEEKGLRLSVEYPTALPAKIIGDPSRLRQILTNLVGNALKFTERGAVRIVPRLDGSRVLIDVVDTGIGISPDKLESVFQPFVQAESSTNRRFGGTGLGLTISRQFAQAMGGDITVASEPGQGTVFTINLDPGSIDAVAQLTPAELAAQPLAATVIEAGRWEFPAANILVVDDGAENRELVRVVLEEVGLGVSEAEHGQRALDMVADGHFDLVLMDVQMPVMDGFTATRLLRQRGFQLPILALTANAMKGFEKEIEEAGFSGYSTKPVDIPLLLQTLAGYLGGSRVDAPAPAPAPTQSPAPAMALEPAADPAELLLRSGPPVISRLASHPRLAAVARRFAEQLPAKVAAMQVALQAGQFDELARQAHWLKGAGGSVGYDAFFEPAKDMEKAAKASDRDAASNELVRLADIAARVVIPDAAKDAGDATRRPPMAAGASS